LSRAELSGIAALFKACQHFAGGELRLALALMVLGAVEEGFGLLMIVPLAAAILDEATAALDPERETQLIEQLKAIKPRSAALVVAHRDSTLRHCDSIVAIQHGIYPPVETLSPAE
jgi:ABC-type transport system involved in cytochrome bd biosynthesis fused ATPase/permease subunit